MHRSVFYRYQIFIITQTNRKKELKCRAKTTKKVGRNCALVQLHGDHSWLYTYTRMYTYSRAFFFCSQNIYAFRYFEQLHLCRAKLCMIQHIAIEFLKWFLRIFGRTQPNFKSHQVAEKKEIIFFWHTFGGMIANKLLFISIRHISFDLKSFFLTKFNLMFPIHDFLKKKNLNGTHIMESFLFNAHKLNICENWIMKTEIFSVYFKNFKYLSFDSGKI